MTDAREFTALTDLLRDGDFRDSEVIAATEQRIVGSADPDDRDWLLAQLAKAVARTGQWERAATLARSIGSQLDRAAGLRATAQAVLAHGEATPAALGLLREAEEALSGLAPLGWQKPEALTRLARAYWAVCEQVRATRLWEEAVILARAVEGSADRQDSLDSSSVLWEIAESMAEAGHVDWAREISRNIANAGKRQRAIAAIDQITSGGQPSFHSIWLADEG